MARRSPCTNAAVDNLLAVDPDLKAGSPCRRRRHRCPPWRRTASAAPFKSIRIWLSAWVPMPWANFSPWILTDCFRPSDCAWGVRQPCSIGLRPGCRARWPGWEGALPCMAAASPPGRANRTDSKAEDHHTDQNRPGEAALHDRTFSSQGCRQLSPSGEVGPGPEESRSRSSLSPQRSGRVKASPVRPSAAPRRARARWSRSRPLRAEVFPQPQVADRLWPASFRSAQATLTLTGNVPRLNKPTAQRRRRPAAGPNLGVVLPHERPGLLAQRVLVDGQHLAVGEQGPGEIVHLRHVATDQQRGGQQRPERDVRDLLAGFSRVRCSDRPPSPLCRRPACRGRSNGPGRHNARVRPG